MSQENPPHLEELREAIGLNTPLMRSFDEGEQDGAMWIPIPYSNFGRWVKEDSYLDDAEKALPIARLAGISSLSFLVDSRYQTILQYHVPFVQDRRTHSLGVAVVAKQIAEQNGMPEAITRLVSIAGLAHDQATPALGDATKTLDNQHLHEEDFWQDVMTMDRWRFLRRNEIMPIDMDDIIHNRGMLGEVLDIADRITYVMKDLHALGVQPTSKADATLVARNKQLNDMLELDPLIGDIIDTVKINQESQQVYFSDPEKLKIFLGLRALLHQHVYLNPASQARDMYIAELIKPYYSPTPAGGKLDPHLLRIMTDQDLLTYLNQKYFPDGTIDSLPFDNPMRQVMTYWHPDNMETFETMEDAEKRKAEIEQQHGVFVLGIKTIKKFDTGTHYNVLDKNGKIVPFSVYNPAAAELLDFIANSLAKTFLFYTMDTSDFPHPYKS